MTETELAEFEQRAKLAESWGGEANLSALYDCCDAVPKLAAEVRRLQAGLRQAHQVIESYAIDIRNSEPIVGVNLAEQGFCQGEFYKAAQARAEAYLYGDVLTPAPAPSPPTSA